MEKNPQNAIRIGITGHRKLTSAQSSALEPVIKRAIENIIHYYENIHKSTPHIVFSSPVAIGADTLFAKTALKYFDGELKIYLPFEKEEYIKDFETVADRNDFEHLLNDPKVTEIICVNKLLPGERDNLYLKVGQRVVDDNDYMIAVWNEKRAKGTGGTGDIVEYAVDKNKNILVINPEDKELTIRANYLPHLKESDSDKDQPRPPLFTNNLVEDYFNLYDSIAINNQAAYKKIWQRSFRLGWLGAALILSVKVAFNFTGNYQFLLTVLEITCLCIIIIWIWKEKRRSFHKNYLRYRFIAERLRIHSLIYACGYYPIKTETKVIHKALQEIESRYPVGEINKIILLTSYTSKSLAQKKEMVRAFAGGQSTYHKKRKSLLEHANKRNSRIKMACIIMFAGVILYHTVNEFSLNGLLHFNFKNVFSNSNEKPSVLFELSFLLYIFIPATLARFEAVKYLNDWERLITQSNYMNEFFTATSAKVDSVNDDKELYRLLIELNDNMYLENLDWEMFMINKNETIS